MVNSSLPCPQILEKHCHWYAYSQTTTGNPVFLFPIQKENVSVRVGMGASNLKTLTQNIAAFTEITRN